MSTTLDILTPILTAVASSAGSVWVAKRSIEHAFSRALADRRAAFELSLEQKRQEFSRDIEMQRQSGQQALEAFKSQLTLEAEVRRQVAAKKVDALMNIAAATRASIETVYTLSRDDGPHARQEALNSFARALRDGLVLFGAELVAELEAFHRELVSGHVARGRSDRGAPNMADVVVRGEAARNRLFDAIRRELQLGTLGKAETKS